MLLPSDLIRLAELIKLGAETARLFSDTTANGQASKITDAANRILVAADDIIEAGRAMDANEPKAPQRAIVKDGEREGATWRVS